MTGRGKKDVAGKRIDKYSVLLSVSSLLGQEVELDGLLKKILDKVIGVLGAERATLYFVDLGRSEVFSRAAHLPELKEIRLKIGQGVAGFVAKTGHLVKFPGGRFDDHFFPEIDSKTGYTTKSMMTVPIKDRGGVIFSVLQVLNKRGRPFDESDEEFLQTLAAQLGIVLENTSLYTQIKGQTVRDDIEFKNRFNNIIGESEVMQPLFEKVAKVAGTEATVLLRGESGSGKELLARAIHCNSPRAARPFVKIDCTALPESLIENELFGHARGAYTGAAEKYDGKFLKAEGGTVFIDEIGDLPMSLQPKLLRVLQEKQFEPLGGTKTFRVDVRIITATNRNLEEMVARGLFREDLYYRIKVVQLNIPPLRERGATDILALANHFLHHFSHKHGRPGVVLSEASKKMLAGYSWPGNVRELENCLESALIMCDKDRIEPENLNLHQAGQGRRREMMQLPFETAGDLTMEGMEKVYIKYLLEKHGNNRTKVAKILGIGRNTLHRKIKQL